MGHPLPDYGFATEAPLWMGTSGPVALCELRALTLIASSSSAMYRNKTLIETSCPL